MKKNALLKEKVIEILILTVSKHPLKTIAVFLVIAIFLAFFAVYSCYVRYQNGHLDFEIKKREAEFKKIKELIK